MTQRLLVIFLFLLAGCTTTSYQVPPETNTPVPTQAPMTPTIDYVGIQHTLGLDRSIDQLGYEERGFNTCQAGNGYPSHHACRFQYFTLIYFQLLCRDSMGTVSQTLTADDLTPVGNSLVDWKLNGHYGQVGTNSDGFGQIRFASNTRSRHKRLKLEIGNNFLFIEAGDTKRIVAPRDWCP